MEPHTLESFEALANDAAREIAIGRALGLDCLGHSCRYATKKSGMRHNGPCLCGHPYTGGDRNPFANWDLLAEVWKALPRRAPDFGELPAWEWALRHFQLAEGIRWHVDGSETYDPDEVPDEDLIEIEAPTPHRAACRALVAAGLVPREETL